MTQQAKLFWLRVAIAAGMLLLGAAAQNLPENVRPVANTLILGLGMITLVVGGWALLYGKGPPTQPMPLDSPRQRGSFGVAPSGAQRSRIVACVVLTGALFGCWWGLIELGSRSVTGMTREHLLTLLPSITCIGATACLFLMPLARDAEQSSRPAMNVLGGVLTIVIAGFGVFALPALALEQWQVHYSLDDYLAALRPAWFLLPCAIAAVRLHLSGRALP